jgi:hypothetical protein
VGEESAEEKARIAEEARRRAYEEGAIAKEQAKAEADRMKTDVLTGESGEEVVRQLGLIYGGLIGIGVVMVQAFLAAPSLDRSAKVSVIAFSVAIPLLAALVMVNRQETFRRRLTPSRSVTITRVVGQAAAFLGIVAGFWHLDWIAGVTFLAAGLVGALVHSAGYVRLERDQNPSKGGPP